MGIVEGERVGEERREKKRIRSNDYFFEDNYMGT